LKDCWWDTIVLNVQAPTEDKMHDVKDGFYKKRERVFVLFGDFNAEVGREDIFKPTIGNESLHKISNQCNGGRVVMFATSKNLTANSVTFINFLGHFMMERLAVKLNIF
jgi:hypothetical protein